MEACRVFFSPHRKLMTYFPVEQFSHWLVRGVARCQWASTLAASGGSWLNVAEAMSSCSGGGAVEHVQRPRWKRVGDGEVETDYY